MRSRLWRLVLALALLPLLLGCPSRGSDPAGASSSASPSASALASPAPSADTLTHASELAGEDAAASVVSGDEVDGNALRARNRARLAADKGPVTVLQSRDAHPAFDLGKRLCDAVVPRVAPSTPVLLKPNMGGFDWFKDPAKTGGDDGLRGRITDPEFVRGVIRCLRARGHEHITVAEGWGAYHKDWEKLVDVFRATRA